MVDKNFFWKNNPKKGLKWAKKGKNRPKFSQKNHTAEHDRNTASGESVYVAMSQCRVTVLGQAAPEVAAILARAAWPGQQKRATGRRLQGGFS